jgi:hypothetical protein
MRHQSKVDGGPMRLAAILVLLWCVVSAVRAGIFERSSPLPSHARYTFVLDGQGPSGSRSFEGLRLLREGKTDTLVLSGTEIGGGFVFSMLWVRMLPLSGPERQRTLELRSACTSTQDEARMADSAFSGLGADTVVVVTSAYHAWRANSIFNRVARSTVVFRVHEAVDPGWDRGWSDRESRKMRLMEWTKRIVWVLWEQWFPKSGPLPPHVFVRGAGLGEVPPPSWTP